VSKLFLDTTVWLLSIPAQSLEVLIHKIETNMQLNIGLKHKTRTQYTVRKENKLTKSGLSVNSVPCE